MKCCMQCDAGKATRYCRWCHFLTCDKCMPDRVCTHCQTFNQDYRVLAGTEEFDDLV